MKGLYWTAAQRLALETQLELTQDASIFGRTLALLEVDEGRAVQEVARELQVHRSNVYRWIERFAAEKRPEALERKPGQGRPRQWTQEAEEWLAWALEKPPIAVGYAANGWTLPLLQGFLAGCLPQMDDLSLTTLRRRLHEMGYVWKRFRYVLAPDPQEAKKNARFWPKSRLCPPGRLFWRRMRRTSCSSRHCVRAGLAEEKRPRS